MKDEKSKITAVAIEKMIDFYQGNLRDIEHFLKVWAYAKTIGEQESVDENTQGILELAAVVHDISCPLCREKYGNTNGKNQELESEPLVKEFFEGMPVSEQKVERIIWLVTHHHTYTNIDGIDYQILIEADFLVNASESNFSKVSIENGGALFRRTRWVFGCNLAHGLTNTLLSLFVIQVNGLLAAGCLLLLAASLVLWYRTPWEAALGEGEKGKRTGRM